MRMCPRCQKGFRADGEDGTKLLTEEFVHDWCRTGEEHLEQMIGYKLEEAEMAIEANSTAWRKVSGAIEETKEEIRVLEERDLIHKQKRFRRCRWHHMHIWWHRCIWGQGHRGSHRCEYWNQGCKTIGKRR